MSSLLKILLYLHSFGFCCLANTRNSTKFLENWNLQ